MKKLLFVLLSMLFFSSSPMMGEEKMIDLNLEIIDDSPAGPGRGKAPIRKPIVNQEGQKITFLSSHPEYTINIIQNDEVIYSFVIPFLNTYEKNRFHFRFSVAIRDATDLCSGESV